MPSFSQGLLKVEDLGDGQWLLLESFSYWPDGAHEIAVPAGLQTDFGSVPQIFRNIVKDIGSPQDKAYILHDWLYATEWFSWKGRSYRLLEEASECRSACDWTLLEAMQALGVGWWTRNVVWSAVRLGGGGVWAKHTQESIAAARALAKEASA